MSVIVVQIYVFVFFFKQKTAYEMRISDWSSDVCSSDLLSRSTSHSAADWSSAGKDNRMSAEAGPCSRICPVSRMARHERKRGRSYALALRAWPSRSTDGMSDADPSTQRLISVELDEGSIVWSNPNVEKDRRVASFALITEDRKRGREGK